MLTRNSMRMIAVVLPLMAGLAFGQGLTDKGVKVGLNLANVSGDVEELDIKMKLGFALGGYATFDFGLPVLIQPEVMFTQKGFKADGSETVDGITLDVKSTTGLNYLDINALAVYPVNDQIRVFAGPSFAPFLSGKGKAEVDISVEGEIDPILQAIYDEMEEELTGEIDIESDDMNGMDMALIFGGSYALTLPFGDIAVEARYSLGLKNAFDAVAVTKNNVIQFIVGYGF